MVLILIFFFFFRHLCVSFFLFQASNLSQIGLDLEENFEKDLNKLLIFHEANENRFQSLP